MLQSISHGLLVLIGVLLEGISTSSPEACTCTERHGDAAVLQNTVNAGASDHIFFPCDRGNNNNNNSDDDNNNSSDDNNDNNNINNNNHHNNNHINNTTTTTASTVTSASTVKEAART